MLIEIQCENISSFDATVGKYVECGEKMIVSGEKAGETVECTKCNQPIEIPLPGETQSARTANRSEEPSVVKSETPANAKSQVLEQRSGQQRRSVKPRRTSESGRSSDNLGGKPKSTKAGVGKTRQRSGAAPQGKSSGERQAAGKRVATKSAATKSAVTRVSCNEISCNEINSGHVCRAT